MITLYGVPFSAHTRKVIVAARHKGIALELVPTVPLMPTEQLPAPFVEHSPLRKIPVLVDDGFGIADSSVIAQYLERRHPQPPLFPAEPRAHARALFIEEFVDGGLAEAVLHGVLFQRVFGPQFLGLEPDHALIHRSLHEIIPARLAYLEQALGGDWFVGDALSYADITVASMLLNLHLAGESLDETATPRLYRFLRRIAQQPALKAALQAEVGPARGVPGLDLRIYEQLGA